MPSLQLKGLKPLKALGALSKNVKLSSKLSASVPKMKLKMNASKQEVADTAKSEEMSEEAKREAEKLAAARTVAAQLEADQAFIRDWLAMAKETMKSKKRAGKKKRKGARKKREKKANLMAGSDSD